MLRKEYKVLKISAGPANCQTPQSILCLAKSRNFLMEGLQSLIDQYFNRPVAL